MTKFDLQKYRISKEIVEEFPKLIEILNIINYELYPYQKFAPITEILHKVHETKGLIKIQLDHYTKIHEDKGLVEDVENE